MPILGPDRRREALPVAAAVIVAAVVLAVSVLLGLGPFADEEPYTLEAQDRLGDCREAGRDTGERCDPGADIETTTLQRLDERTLRLVLRLTEAPDLHSGLEWTVEFFADSASAYTGGGVICGLSNVGGGGSRGSELTSYALAPNTVPRQALEAAACEGRLDGADARFDIDVTGQPEAAEFRLIGLVRLAYPGDRDRPGSEDDFLVRTSLSELAP